MELKNENSKKTEYPLRAVKILLITPILPEYHAAREIFAAAEIPSTEKTRLAEKKTGGRTIRILQCGLGSAALIPFKTQLEEFRPQLLIDSGSCGSLREDLAPGTILYIDKVIHESGSALSSRIKMPAGSISRDCIRYKMLEVSKPVMSSEHRSTLRERYAADACSMESYLLAKGAEELSIDWISLRIVTDFSNKQTPGDFKKNIRRFSLDLYGKIRQILEQDG